VIRFAQYLLCFVAVPAGVLSEADADVRLKDAVPRALQASRERLAAEPREENVRMRAENERPREENARAASA
jgi:hypothetical protein